MNAYREQAMPGLGGGVNRRIDPALEVGRGDPKVEPAFGSRVNVISNLEGNVTRLQVARANIAKIQKLLEETGDFLAEGEANRGIKEIPASVVNSYILDRVSQVRQMTERTSFQGRALLNGECGVTGQVTGDNLYFVRGSARILDSSQMGYPVAIEREARPSTLLGTAPISAESLAGESMIALVDGNQEVRYKPQAGENPESLVKNLQKVLWENGLDISVYRTRDNRLFLMHNQLGSRTHFAGLSYKTQILSLAAGRWHDAKAGQDIAGTIGLEPATGNGGFLVGNPGNARTDGLVIHYDGMMEYSGQIVGYVQTRQNGILVPLDLAGAEVELLSLPSLLPETLGVGVANYSGFKNLNLIKGNNRVEQRDSGRLIRWTVKELECLAEDLKWKEDAYVELAIDLLKNGMRPSAASESVMYLSKESAGSMAQELKEMITPQMLGSFSSWQ